MSRVVGADVWKNGWIAVVTVGGWIASIDAYETMSDLATSESDAEVVAVDIPIGLPIAPPRPADSAARHFIGARSSSVFPTPPRCARSGDVPGCAAAFSQALRHRPDGTELRAAPRILETDNVARSDPRLIEIHPEVTFAPSPGGRWHSRRRVGMATPSAADFSRALDCRSPIVSPMLRARSHPTTCSMRLRERGRPPATRRVKQERFPRRPHSRASAR